MANTIITKNSATATAVPTAGQLVQGELAVNVTDKRLFTENSGGTVVEVGTNPSTIAVAGNATVGGTLGVTGLATLASSTLTANPTLSAGTANGVTYLNGSKVLTSGSGLTTNGNSLGVGSSDFGGAGSINVSVGVAGTTTGGLQLWSTTTGQHYVQFGDGTAGAATYAGAIGYSHATDQMFFYANAAEQMRLTSTGLGIGTSSPQVQLHLQSDAPVIRLTDTTANTNAEIFCNSAAGSMYLRADKDNTAANSVIGFQIDGSDKMTLDSSGNLGLGVTPSAWISAYKGFDIGTTTSLYGRTDSTMEFALALNGYRASSGSWLYRNNGAAARYNQNSGTHWWDVAPSGTAGGTISFTQAMTLDASGRLGIGLTSMGRELQIYSSAPSVQLQNASSGTTNTDGFQLQLSGSDAYISNWENGAQIFATNSTERLRIDSSGTVLIGESSSDLAATSKALVIGSAGFGVQHSGSTGTYLKINPGAANGTVDFKFDARSGNYPAATFWTSNEERVRIDSSGNFMVGITVNQGAKVSVAAAESVAYWGRTTATGAAVNVLWNSATSGDNQFALFYSDGGPSLRGSITLNRGAGLIAFNTTSDYRAKEVSGSVQNALSIVTQLKPYMGKMKGATVERPMFIAHETQAIAPYAVTGDKDAVDQDGKPLFQQMDHSSLVPLLTAALQEALAKIESLTARVSALEGN
jgi:hypothetical protein